MAGLMVIAITAIVIGVLLSVKQSPRRTAPAPFFYSLDGLLPSDKEVPSKYHGEDYSIGNDTRGFRPEVGLLEGRLGSGSKCSDLTDRCRSVSFELYRFTNSSMAGAYLNGWLHNL